MELSDRTSIDQMFEMIEKEYGRLDILVNNAYVTSTLTPSIPVATGRIFHGSFAPNVPSDIFCRAVVGCLADGLLEADVDSMRATFEMNVWGTLRITQRAVSLMKKNGYGRVVNVSAQQSQLSCQRMYVDNSPPYFVVDFHCFHHDLQ